MPSSVDLPTPEPAKMPMRLALAEVQERVHGAYADIELLADAASEIGGRRAGAQGVGEGA
jgi:hypothetical protein